jgi:hypothetical protein
LVADARRKLALQDEPRNVFRPDPDTLQLFYEGRTYLIDVPTGQVIVEVERAMRAESPSDGLDDQGSFQHGLAGIRPKTRAFGPIPDERVDMS